MPCLLIRHKVRDYGTWESVFDEHESTRRANGSQGGGFFAAPSIRMRFCSSWSGTTSSGRASLPIPTICGRR